jgi:Tfp pilus assembly protein PilX
MIPMTTSPRRPRPRSEGGFTMLIVLGVLLVTMLLATALFAAVQSDATLTRADLNGKEAYAAAQAGVQAYLYQLNDNASNSSWWETCSNDTVAQTAVPGSTTGETYSYQPVWANGSSATTCTSNPVQALIDTTTGTLRIAFTGYAGTGGQAEQRTVVSSFRTLSPLSFLWYTVYESVDTSIGGSSCGAFYYSSSPPPSSCDIYWVTGDVMNGPMYTQDQFLVYPGDAPTFGRSGSDDQIASQVPTSANSSEICASDNCSGATVDGSSLTPSNANSAPKVSPQVPLPTDNSNLLTDATNHGQVYSGTVTLTVTNSGGITYGNGWDCTSATACTQIQNLNLTQNQIIYATNASGCSSPTYDPTNVTYPVITSTTSPAQGAYYGACGDVYVSGTYSTPLTIAAADDVIVTGNLLNSTDTNPTGTASPTGGSTLGLVANEYVRVMHDATCATSNGNPNVTIDGAILTLQHSFFVDNYQCGGMPQGKLTVHGAIAQYFRGIVGSVGSSGYLKNYNYDDRLALILPPYMFDLQNTQWTVFRETLCSSATPSTSSNSCSYTGS